MNIKGHTIQDGVVEGEALVTDMAFSFLGDFDIVTGQVDERHALAGRNIAGKILVFPTGRGSTTGALVGYYARLFNTAPVGMICREAEPVIALNALSNGIPMMDRLEKDPLSVIRTGDLIRLDATRGVITILTTSDKKE
ncbi:DUF126 domain-containing protein [Desulfatiferula olefinivorans]